MAWTFYLLHYTLKSLTIIVVLTLVLFSISKTAFPLIATFIAGLEIPLYNLGAFGAYPTLGYFSFHLQAPRAQVLQWDERCSRGNIFLTPNGPSVAHPGPMILNAQGQLVWMSDEFGPSANLKVQQYKGQNYLTFWAGDKLATSGKGNYYMLDSHYRIVRILSAAGQSAHGDLHEMKITEAGTALVTVYNTTNADLSAMGRPRRGWIVDSIFQEIDIETGQLLFEWKASEHFDPSESYMTHPLGGYIARIPFDFFHINSIDKDHAGNYLISSRHYHSLSCISPGGETLWTLGGPYNDFTDLSSGEATNFKWQHDARWISSEDGLLALFDNGKAGALHADAACSRGMILQLDIANRTVSLIRSFTSSERLLTASQGSMQVLPETGTVFIGWGSAAAYTEHTPDGSLLCETHLGASWFFSMERMKTYRTIKSIDWHAVPRDPPNAVVVEDKLYVSWNGATEVAFWALEAVTPGTDSRSRLDENADGKESKVSQEYATIDIIPKESFESVFDLRTLDGLTSQFRVAALDGQQKLLRYTDVVDYHRNTSHRSMTILFWLFGLIGVIIGCRNCERVGLRPGTSWCSKSKCHLRT